MGGCASVPQTKNMADQAEHNKFINKQITSDVRKAEKEIKLLLLGAGESGKTTISKQMRIIHLKGFPEEERLTYKSIIFSNTISAMRVLVEASKNLDIPLEPKNVQTSEKLLALEDYFSDTLTQEVAGFIKVLWTDSGIQETYTRSAAFQLNDSASYFFQDIDRLALPNYIPTEQDVIRSRAKTTGIIETEFDYNDHHFRLVDVGGQRSERKKWMHCFQEVTAVIFCVAMSEYDLKLYEDDTTNRMEESLKLFKEICNNKWFTDTSMILFLNKKDVFEQKIKTVDLNVCFPDYTGGKEYEPAARFIEQKFIAQNENPAKKVYPHVICATNTDNILQVFKSVQETLLVQTAKDADM